jgi:hypothetical protein
MDNRGNEIALPTRFATFCSEGRRPTHRAVFAIRGEGMVVLAVRHLAQQDLSPDDVEG